jgi:hypothetical protein
LTGIPFSFIIIINTTTFIFLLFAAVISVKMEILTKIAFAFLQSKIASQDANWAMEDASCVFQATVAVMDEVQADLKKGDVARAASRYQQIGQNLTEDMLPLHIAINKNTMAILNALMGGNTAAVHQIISRCASEAYQPSYRHMSTARKSAHITFKFLAQGDEQVLTAFLEAMLGVGPPVAAALTPANVSCALRAQEGDSVAHRSLIRSTMSVNESSLDLATLAATKLHVAIYVAVWREVLIKASHASESLKIFANIAQDYAESWAKAAKVASEIEIKAASEVTSESWGQLAEQIRVRASMWEARVTKAKEEITDTRSKHLVEEITAKGRIIHNSFRENLNPQEN